MVFGKGGGISRRNKISILRSCQAFSDQFAGPMLHNGPKSLILAPQDIPDFSGYQLGFGCQCVKAYNNENPVTNQKIL